MGAILNSDAIFMVANDTLVPMVSTAYESESRLQRLLADFPDLIAGAQIDPDDPRRWVLVGREIGVPDHEGGSDRWSVDNLFLDQDAVPTVIEVKRSTDTRIRREVVGQMLDYAANGIRYWPIDDLRSNFEACHEHPEEAIADLTESNYVYDDFWRQVESNLKSNRIRMIWVADVIPTELLTIIEYLNDQLTNAEALAVEIQQYVGEGVQTLVPRVLGMSATKRAEKRSRTASFEDNLAHSNDATKTLVDLFWALGDTDGYETTTTKTGLKVRFAGRRQTAMLLYPQWNSVEFSLGAIADAGLDQDASDLQSAFSAIAGHQVTERQPYVSSEAALASWQELVDDILPRYQQAHAEAQRLRIENENEVD